MSDEKKPSEPERDDQEATDEELESVSGGCQWGNETMTPKLSDFYCMPELPTFDQG